MDFHARTFFTIALEGLEILREIFHRAKNDEVATFQVFLDRIVVSNRSTSKPVRDLYFNTIALVTYDRRDIRKRYLTKACARNAILKQKLENHFTPSTRFPARISRTGYNSRPDRLRNDERRNVEIFQTGDSNDGNSRSASRLRSRSERGQPISRGDSQRNGSRRLAPGSKKRTKSNRNPIQRKTKPRNIVSSCTVASSEDSDDVFNDESPNIDQPQKSPTPPRTPAQEADWNKQLEKLQLQEKHDVLSRQKQGSDGNTNSKRKNDSHNRGDELPIPKRQKRKETDQDPEFKANPPADFVRRNLQDSPQMFLGFDDEVPMIPSIGYVNMEDTAPEPVVPQDFVENYRKPQCLGRDDSIN